MKSVTNDDAAVAVAISMLKTWLSEIYPPKQIDAAIAVDMPKRRIRAKVWTATNEYTITVAIEESGTRNPEDVLAASYLGATSVSRLQRPGETWSRGSDLPDGRFSAETWRAILAGIVRHEVQEVESAEWRE